MLILNAVLMMVIALQMQAHFSQASAQLVPNYVMPHVIPIACLWLSGILLQCIPLLLWRVPVAAALGVNLLFWGLFCGVGLLGSLRQLGPGGRVIMILLGLTMSDYFSRPWAM